MRPCPKQGGKFGPGAARTCSRTGWEGADQAGKTRPGPTQRALRMLAAALLDRGRNPHPGEVLGEKKRSRILVAHPAGTWCAGFLSSTVLNGLNNRKKGGREEQKVGLSQQAQEEFHFARTLPCTSPVTLWLVTAYVAIPLSSPVE